MTQEVRHADIIEMANRMAAEYTPVTTWTVNKIPLPWLFSDELLADDRRYIRLRGPRPFYPKRHARSMKGK